MCIVFTHGAYVWEGKQSNGGLVSGKKILSGLYNVSETMRYRKFMLGGGIGLVGGSGWVGVGLLCYGVTLI